MKQTAIVIGAGIGGIATAARLAKNGCDVTVLEKNETPGGRCNQIIKDGHRFDIGPTLFLMPEVWEETFASLGEKMSDHLDLRRIDPTYKVRFDDGLELELTSDIGKMQTQLEKVEKTAFTFGLSHNFWQVGYLRPHNRHKKYKNLYFAGASTHPGTGLPIVLLSARLTTERILKERGTIAVQKVAKPAFKPAQG